MTIPSVMEVCSNALRGIIVAPSERKLVAADLSNIEGRVLPWLAGEEWKLQAFRDFDAGVGPDIYKLAYARAFRIDPERVDKFQRQIGKGLELSMGYGGGVGAFLKIALSYGLDIEAMAVVMHLELPEKYKFKAMETWEWAVERRKTFGPTQKQYVVCDSLKQMWRDAHPAIVRFWKDCETAVRCAINGTEPPVMLSGDDAGTRVVAVPGGLQVGFVTFDRKGNWLRIRLPSGRFLCYPSPKVDEGGKISYWGLNQYSRKWQKLTTYGGKLAENIDQAISRDIMAHAMPRAEARGYKIVLTVHDEIVTETPDTHKYSAAGLAAIMSTNPPWAVGLPLAAAGEESYRYGK